MSLRFDIYKSPHSDPRVYVPGDPVKGTVIYTPTKQTTVNSATIEFTGKVQVYHDDAGLGGGETEKIELFYFKRQLFQGPYDVQAKALEWQFDFTFPMQCKHEWQEESDPNLDGYIKYFLPSGMGELPPTFYVNLSALGTSNAYVKYKVVAKVDAGTTQSREIEHPLKLRRITSEPWPAPVPEWHKFPRARWESRSLRTEPHDLKRKVRHIFTSDVTLKTPRLVVDATIQFPKALSLTQQTPVAFAIQYIREGPADPEEPTLYLDEVKFELGSIAMTRMGNHRKRSDNERPFNDYIVKPRNCILPLNGEPVTIIAEMAMQNWAFKDFWGHIGDFSTYSIHHFHQMKVKADIIHKDPRHIFNIEATFPFKLLDPYIEQRGAPLQTDATMSEDITEDGPPPPDYSEEKTGLEGDYRRMMQS